MVCGAGSWFWGCVLCCEKRCFLPRAFQVSQWVREVHLWRQERVQDKVPSDAKQGRVYHSRSEGGALLCRLFKDSQFPPLTKLKLTRQLQLEPQRWMPWVELDCLQRRFLLGGDRLVGEAEVEVDDRMGSKVQRRLLQLTRPP